MELAMRRQSFLPSFMIELRPTQAGGQGDPTFRFRAPAYQHGNSPRDHSHHDASSGDSNLIMCRRDVIGHAGARRRKRRNRS